MLISPVGANIGVNFAIPADAAIPVIAALKWGERPQRGYLGVGIVPMTDDYAAAVGLPQDRGEIVQRLEDGGSADRKRVGEGPRVVVGVDAGGARKRKKKTKRLTAEYTPKK